MPIKPADVVSGIQPTGQLHLGNYLGAVANWVTLQDSYSCIYLVVDLHAMTSQVRPSELRRNTEELLVDLMACGLDPERSTLLIQSLIPEHAFLQWILSCHCPSNELLRLPQYKEQSNGPRSASAGLLTYPVLQAADILAYKGRYVPVGKDQEQHLELARTVARKFNNYCGASVFPEPQPLFTPTPKIMSLLDPTRKMSKDSGDCISLFEDEATIRGKIKASQTDSGDLAEGELGLGVRNLLEILKSCGSRSLAQELEKDCRSKGTRRYSSLKRSTADAVVKLASRLKARRDEVVADQSRLFRIILDKSDQARELVRETLRDVCDRIGLREDAFVT